MKTTNFTAITNGISGTASFTSSAFWIWDNIKLSAQAVVSSGSLLGNITLQFSNDKATGAFPNQFQPTHWNTLGSTTQMANCSSSPTLTSFMIPQFEPCYQYARVVFNDLSGGTAIGVFSVQINTFAL